jgi:hypothetical protein
MLLINEELTKKIKYIADNFEKWSVKENIDEEQFIWFVEFDEPDLSYEFSMSRMGVSNKGKFIWDGTSGCSCPSPWHEGLGKSDYFDIKETIELPEAEYGNYVDKDWNKQLFDNVERIYLALKSPNKLTASQVLEEKNAEVRRVLIEKIGFERFVDLAKPEIIDKSTIGELLKIKLQGDEDIVLLSVKDASTDRNYLLRVPPNMKTALQAKAWTFGFKENEFNPIVET